METKITNLTEFNKMCRETLDRYYRLHSAEEFFKIDAMLRACYNQGLTKEDVPTLIEMQNVIVMG